MVPVENPFHGGYSYYGSGGCVGVNVMSRVKEGYECCNTCDQANNYCLGSISSSSDHHRRHLLESEPMADEESRTTGSLNDAAASSSKDAREERLDDEGWLQLGIGGRSSNNDKKFDKERASNASDNNINLSHQAVNLAAPERSSGLVELDLLPPGTGGSERPRRPPLAPVFHRPELTGANSRQPQPPNYSLPFNFFQHPGSASSSFPHSSQEVQWAFRSSYIPPNIIAGSLPPASASLLPMSPSSASYNLMPFVGSYFARPVMAGVDVGGSSSDIRIMNAPRRPHSGIWFMLQASQNQ